MATDRPRIAVVDDEAPVRRALERLLRSVGMEVCTFHSGIQFLEECESAALDCVVLDLHMPDINGFEVQEQLNEVRSTLPVIVITGHDATETQNRVMAAGASAYLLKPIDESVLLEAIALAIAGRSA